MYAYILYITLKFLNRGTFSSEDVLTTTTVVEVMIYFAQHLKHLLDSTMIDKLMNALPMTPSNVASTTNYLIFNQLYFLSNSILIRSRVY